jgi:hypothetical protein
MPPETATYSGFGAQDHEGNLDGLKRADFAFVCKPFNLCKVMVITSVKAI